MTLVKQQASNNELAIELTEAAKNHILNYLAKDEKSQGVRFSVKKTGCSGLSYVIEYLTSIHEEDITQALTDDYLLCVDKKSYPFLKGMRVDYIRQGLNSKFNFSNPNQTGQCGCGESFTVEDLA